MKKELETLEDVQLLVRSFYSKVLRDEVLRHYFSYVVAHHWDKHLELLDRFWNDMIFHAGGYEGNPLQTHRTLHHFSALNTAAFERWLHLFNETVDALFEGEKARFVKQRALAIATVMQVKILTDKKDQFASQSGEQQVHGDG